MAKTHRKSRVERPEHPDGNLPTERVAYVESIERGLREQDLRYEWKHLPPEQWSAEAVVELMRRLDAYVAKYGDGSDTP